MSRIHRRNGPAQVSLPPYVCPLPWGLVETIRCIEWEEALDFRTRPASSTLGTMRQLRPLVVLSGSQIQSAGQSWFLRCCCVYILANPFVCNLQMDARSTRTAVRRPACQRFITESEPSHTDRRGTAGWILSIISWTTALMRAMLGSHRARGRGC